MNIGIDNIPGTASAVAVIMFLVSAIKKTGINPKFLPLMSLAVGIGVVWAGTAAGLMPISGSAIIWYGIVTGIMATGGWSGAKNVYEGLNRKDDTT